MTRIVAHLDDGTQEDVTRAIMYAMGPEMLRHLVSKDGQLASGWLRDQIIYLERYDEEQLRAEFDAVDGPERDRRYQQWLTERGEQ